MAHFVRAVLEVYSTASLWKDMPVVFASGGIAVAGGAALFGLFWVLEYCLLSKQRRNQFLRVGKDAAGQKTWRQRHWHIRENVLQMLLKFAFIISLGIIIWVSGAVVGFNPFTTSAAMLVMGIVMTYMFAGPLGAWGYSLALMLDNQLYIGQHWEFHGMGAEWDGIITGIYTFEVEMMRTEKDGHTTIVTIPISNFFTSVRKSDPKKQEEYHKGEIYRPSTDVSMKKLDNVHQTRTDDPNDQNRLHAANSQLIMDPMEVRVAIAPPTSTTKARVHHRIHARTPELLLI